MKRHILGLSMYLRMLYSEQFFFRMSSGTEIRISIMVAGRAYPLATINKVASGFFISLF